jgi:RNA polymerase sigma-70 factor, ECF subfamily
VQQSPILLQPGPREVIRAHQTEIWRFLRYLGAQAELAEDLCQETFLIWLDCDDEEIQSMNPSHLRAWLRGVSRNLFLQSLRKTRRLPALDIESEPGLVAAEEVWLRRAGEDGGELYLSALQHCMQQLEDRERRALEQRYGHNASRERIGSTLGLGDSGVKSLLRRARARLKLCIQRKVGA